MLKQCVVREVCDQAAVAEAVTGQAVCNQTCYRLSFFLIFLVFLCSVYCMVEQEDSSATRRAQSTAWSEQALRAARSTVSNPSTPSWETGAEHGCSIASQVQANQSSAGLMCWGNNHYGQATVPTLPAGNSTWEVLVHTRMHCHTLILFPHLQRHVWSSCLCFYVAQ